jgi:hypothetical protein
MRHQAAQIVSDDRDITDVTVNHFILSKLVILAVHRHDPTAEKAWVGVASAWVFNRIKGCI